MIRLTLLICTISIVLHSCVPNEEHKAQWITTPSFQHKPNQWFQLRKSLSIEKVPHKAIAKIAVDSKYWLYINGEMVIREGMLKRGPNPHDTYYDEVDLAPYLQEGRNTIAVLAWYFGREGFSHKDSKQFGFLFDMQLNHQNVVSDSTWKIRPYTAYQELVGGHPANWRLPEGNVQFNATNETEDWIMPQFDDSDWDTPVLAGAEGVAPWNKLVKRAIPQWKDFGLKTSTDFEQDSNRVTLKLPYNMQYHFWLKVKAPEGKQITVKSDSYDWLNGAPVRGQYITKAGEQVYEHLPWMSGHAIIYEFDKEVEILEVGYRETGYNTKLDGTFNIDNSFLTRLFEKAKNTLYINMRDTYFDCPDRERAQWWGDMVLLMEESFFLMDNDAIALSTKGIRELVDWQKPNGSLFSPIPAGNWTKELPHQMLAVIGVGFKNYLNYTGDLETYKYVYPAVKRYLNLWTVHKDGHLTSAEREFWGWYDHGEKIDAELLEYAWYSIALETFAHMAQLADEPTEVEKAKAARQRIKSFVNKTFWTEQGYRSTNYTDEIDDRGNGLLVVAGIAEPRHYDTIASILKNIRHSSPYIDKYQLDALFIMGKKEQALQRIYERYGMMVNSRDISTLWEIFEQGNWSYNHGWSGGPVIMMYKKLAGINPTQPGFSEFEVFPELKHYDTINCSFSTVRGKVKLNYRKDKGVIKQELEVPEKSTAIVRIPANAINWSIEGGQYVRVKTYNDEAYSYYKLKGGEWIIRFKTS